MNDLERDLQQLFEQRAREVDPAVLAPETVIRRGHRRQARTVVGGALAGIIAITVAIATVGNIHGPDGAVPGGADPWPARSTVIGGVPVTAPAGWTLIDDTPMLNVTVTSSESCSFSGTGTEVGANGSPVASAQAPQPSESCTSTPVAMPAGVPFLQLANFEIPLMETVCDWSGGPTTSLPADGVAIYVASFPAGMDTQPLLDACPGSEHYGSITGSNASTFGLMSRDGSVGFTMAAVGIAGPGASDEDIAVARTFFEQPIFGQTNPYVTLDPNRVGPGYVLTAGGNAAAGWRLEAGITSSANNGRPIPGAILAIAEDGEERTAWAAPAMGSLGTVEADLQRVGSEVVQWGTVSSRYSGVEIDGPDAAVTRAALYAWPQGLVEIADSQPFADPGSIWIATPPQEGTVTFVPVGDPIETGTPSPTPVPVTQALDYRVLDSGAVVATGNDFGADWQLTDVGRLGLIFGGVDYGETSVLSNGGYFEDVAGGTLWISRQPQTVDAVSMSSDIAGNYPIAAGRWMPAAKDALGGPGRVWVVALPGSGSGYEHNGDGGLPVASDWPSREGPPQTGDITESGANDRIAWKLTWTDATCPVVEVFAGVQEGDTGTTPCLTPWDGTIPVIGGVYGKHTSLVVITGPADMFCGDLATAGGTITSYDPFANTGACYIALPVGETIDIQLTDTQDNPILGSRGQFTVHARPGSLDVS